MNNSLYHYTKKENTENILKGGLLKSKSNFWVKLGGAVYLSTQPIKRKGCAILKITLPKNFLKGKCYLIDNQEHLIFKNIPSKYINGIMN